MRDGQLQQKSLIRVVLVERGINCGTALVIGPHPALGQEGKTEDKK